MNRSMLKIAGFVAFTAITGTALAVRTVNQPVKETILEAGGPEPTDSIFINSWGLVTVGDVFWVANNGTGTAAELSPDGATLRVINVNGNPPENAVNGPATGVVHNPDEDFEFSNPVTGASGPSRLLFAEEDGTVAAWNPEVDADNALVVINTNIGNREPAIFKGLTLAFDNRGRHRLYAANFGIDGPGEIQIYDTDFNQVGSFTEHNLPKVPREAGEGAVYTPFNVIAFDNNLVVTFAVKMPGEEDEIHCDGCGFVEVFSANGKRITRVPSNARGSTGRELFNAPWGVSLAPPQFGAFGDGVALMGNFGSGTILAFKIHTAQFLGTLTTKQHPNTPLVIDGLWGIDRSLTADNTLFFAAGPEDETEGLVGTLTPDP